ncbi:MAG: RNA polymerase sigma factor [Gemmatimonadetes bacterium]|nr:RNA polymerase sigma factor [Gemmatimonadota bacterium]
MTWTETITAAENGREQRAAAERERLAARVTAAANGDQRAFRDLMDAYRRAFYGIARRYTGSHEDADDVLQDAFVKIYQNLQTLSSPEAFFPWARRIVINTALDRIRRQRRTAEVETASDDPEIAERESVFESPDRAVEKSEFYRELERSLEELPPRQRQVVTLHDVGGLSTEEVADRLGLPPATVRSNLFYGREKLRRMLVKDRASSR